MKLILPLRVVSATNSREHHHRKADRVRVERETVAWAWIKARRDGQAPPPLPVVVTLTRVLGKGQRLFDEGDNLPAAFKAIRDQIGKELGTGDGPKAPVRWVYKQVRGYERGSPVEFNPMVLIDIEEDRA